MTESSAAFALTGRKNGRVADEYREAIKVLPTFTSLERKYVTRCAKAAIRTAALQPRANPSAKK